MKPTLHTLLLLVLATPLFSQIPCNGSFIPSGTAVAIGDCIQLTGNATAQNGCAFLDSPIDFSEPFAHTMTASFGNIDANGADGICLVYQTGGVGNCGISGQGIGAQGIPNSFIVEFDTWDNGVGVSDIPADHCAVSINGNLSNPINGPVALPNIEDGNDHAITFTWNPATNGYTVAFDGNIILTGTFDIINGAFGGNATAFWGYTSATGAATNVHRVCPDLPDPLIVDAGINVTVPCNSATLTLNGSGPQGNYTYSWSSPDGGVILSGGNTLMPTVMGPGTYILTLTDPNGGCQESDQVVITENPIVAVASGPNYAPCVGGSVTLSGAGSSVGPNITYLWTTNDGFISGNPTTLNLNVGFPGTYTLTVTYNSGGVICTEQTSVTLLPPIDFPNANAIGGAITCNNGLIALNGSGSTTGPNISYQWATPNGQILNGGNTLTPVVNAPGQYTLTVVNTANNCSDNITVTVEDLTAPPAAQAVVEGMLDCENGTVTLNGTGSATGNMTYAWQTNTGNIVSSNGLIATADAPGAYTLFITDNTTGCFNTATVNVAAGPSGPAISIAPPPLLTCADTTAALFAAATAATPNLTYEWSTPNGQILSGTDTDSLLVNAPGWYLLTVTNEDNGCAQTDSVEVSELLGFPLAEAGPDQQLACGENSLFLDGAASVPGSNGSISWSTPNGSLLNGAQTLSPEAGSPGTYLLAITNTLTGCTSTDTVIVGSDGNAPTAVIAPSDTLNCSLTTAILDAAGSDFGPGYTLLWSTNDGLLQGPVDQLQATAAAPGVYQLTVTDTLNDCATTLTRAIAQDTVQPGLSLSMPDTLTCDRNSLVLSSTAALSGLAFQWSTTNGVLPSVTDGNSLNIEAPGTYTLVALNPENTCADTLSVTVAQDTLSPSISILPPATLTCATPTQALNAAGSDIGAGFSVLWQTTDGQLLSGSTTLAPIIGAAGDYTLRITNNNNGCSSSANVVVAIDTLQPIAEAGPLQTLNCYFPEREIGSAASTDNARTLASWSSSPDGHITGPSEGIMTTADEAGWYYLHIVDTLNGCTAVDSVQLIENYATPNTLLQPADTLNCVDTLITLDGSLSDSGPGLAFTWQNLSSGASTTTASLFFDIEEAGAYTLSIQDTVSGCTSADTVLVSQDVNLPVVSISPAPIINCSIPSVTLQGSTQSPNPALGLQWATPDGNIQQGAQTLAPTVTAGGVYTLEVTDLSNNCRVSASVTVAVDTLRPIAEAGPELTLNCYTTVATLSGSASFAGNTPAASWSTVQGEISGFSDSLFATATQPGLYTLTVLNPDNGCIGTDSVWVGQNLDTPQAALAPPQLLTCNNSQQVLNGNGTTAAGPALFLWATPGQDTLPTVAPSLSISMPGTYTLIVQDSVSGCVDFESVTVQQDTLSPEVAIATPDTLTCDLPSLTLNSSTNTPLPQLLIEWSTQGGALPTPANTLSLPVSAAGAYQLTLTDVDNGCSRATSVTVAIDTLSPIINLAPAPVLNCRDSSSLLEAQALQAGSAPVYNWSTADGQLSGAADGLQAQATAPGTYSFLATNPLNGCSSTGSLLVLQDTLQPVADIAPAAAITCDAPEITLQGLGGSAALQTLWFEPNGSLIGNQPELTVNTAGTYLFRLADPANFCEDTAVVAVAIDTLSPVLSINPADTLNCAVAEILLEGSVMNTTTILVEWTGPEGGLANGAATLSPTAALPGSYQMAVTNTQNGCMATASIEVAQDTTRPTAAIGAVEALTCSNTTIQLNGAASSSGPAIVYAWSGQNGVGSPTPATAVSPSVSAPGTYQLIVSNQANFCADTAVVSVAQDTVAPVASVALPDTLTCSQLNVALDGSSSVYPTTSAQLLWTTDNGGLSGPADAAATTAQAPGTYQLLITNLNNDCSDSMAVVVAQDTLSPLLEIAAPDTLNCQVLSVALEGSSSTQAPLSYLWSTDNGAIIGDAGNAVATASSGGTYTLLATNLQNDCASTAQVEVAQDTIAPVIVAAPPAILTCRDTMIVLNAQGSSQGSQIQLSWTGPTGGLTGGEMTLQPTVGSPGAYTLELANTANFCTATQTFTVAQDIAPPLADAGADFVIPCFPELRQLDGTGTAAGMAYSWSTDNGVLAGGTATLTPAIDGPGSYQLHVFNPVNGCSSTDVVVVSQNLPVASASIIQPLCFGDPALLRFDSVALGEPPYVYAFDGGSIFGSSPVLTVTTPGIYTLVVQDINGCEDEIVLEAIQPDSMMVAINQPSEPLLLGESQQLFAQTNQPDTTTITWSWAASPGLSCYDCPTPIATPLLTTDYVLTATTANGCSGQARVRIFVDKRSPIFVPNIFSPDGNGSNDRFTLFARPGIVSSIRSFRVFSRWGEQVFQAFDIPPNDPAYGWAGHFRGEPMNTGVFAYAFEVELVSGEILLLEGDVTLMR